MRTGKFPACFKERFRGNFIRICLETEKLGEKIAESLHGGEVVALFGGMGMGKTALTRGLVRGLGAPDGVSSPTFALVHEYHGRMVIYHFDMFRVSTWDDLYSTGFFDYLDTARF